MMKNLKYRIVVQWSDDDKCFLVGFPDFPGQEWRTHGDTYEEALSNGTEALESLVMAYQSTGDPLPQPQTISMLS